MQIILLERVEKLGQMGDVVKVKDGYARNFLLPRRKALRATKENVERFEKQKAVLEAQNLKRRSEAEAVATKMEGLSVTLLRQAGESGQLYGSVNARDVADAVTAAGFTINRQQVAIGATIKTLGIFKVRVALHPEVVVQVSVNVARSEEEAESQANAQFFEAGAGPAPEGEEAAAEADAAAPAAEEVKKEPKAKKAKSEKAGAEKAEAAAEGEEAPAPKKKKAAKAAAEDGEEPKKAKKK